MSAREHVRGYGCGDASSGNTGNPHGPPNAGRSEGGVTWRTAARSRAEPPSVRYGPSKASRQDDRGPELPGQATPGGRPRARVSSSASSPWCKSLSVREQRENGRFLIGRQRVSGLSPQAARPYRWNGRAMAPPNAGRGRHGHLRPESTGRWAAFHTARGISPGGCSFTRSPHPPAAAATAGWSARAPWRS